jgi:hypothetical protein
VEKYGRVRQATCDNIIGRMRFALWINAADKHTEYVIVIAYPRRKRLSVMFIRKLTALFHFWPY